MKNQIERFDIQIEYLKNEEKRCYNKKHEEMFLTCTDRWTYIGTGHWMVKCPKNSTIVVGKSEYDYKVSSETLEKLFTYDYENMDFYKTGNKKVCSNGNVVIEFGNCNTEEKVYINEKLLEKVDLDMPNIPISYRAKNRRSLMQICIEYDVYAIVCPVNMQ